MPTSRTGPLRIATPFNESVGVAAAQGTERSCHGVLLKAIFPAQVVYIGTSNALTTATGWPLADGDVIDLAVKNLSQLWFIASAAGQSLRVLPYAMY